MLSQNFQIALSTCEDWEVRQELATIKNLCDDAQENLANDEDSDVLETLAKNSTISVNTQVLLAENTDLNSKTMLILAKSRYSEVLSALLDNEMLDEDIIIELSKNPHIDEDMQLTLAENDDENVLEALFSNSAISIDTKVALAANENLNESIQKKLAKSDNLEILTALAKATITKAAKIIYTYERVKTPKKGI